MKIFQIISKSFKHSTWWQTTFFVIGLIALLSIIGALFFAYGNKPNRASFSDTVDTVETDQFLSTISGQVNSPITSGGTVKPLNNGDEFIPELINNINNANSNINFSVYIWEEGQFSNQLTDALLIKQKSGVQVRILLDSLGEKVAGTDKFEELKQAGVRVAEFRTPKFGQLTRYYKRNHRRAIIIDGKIAFTGGMAVSDQWLGNATNPEKEITKQWRDMMFKLDGPIATNLQSAFADLWASSSGELIVGDKFFPPYSTTNSEVANNQVKSVPLINSPADDVHKLPNFLLLSFYTAKKNIKITTPYFIPDEDMLTALKTKAEQGVKIEILLPGPVNDNKILRLGGQNNYLTLLKSGVKIYEYSPTFIHSKYFTVDDTWTVMGSANLNSRSRRLDEENIIGVQDNELAQQMNKTFEDDKSDAENITFEHWQNRNIIMRTLQFLSQAIEKQS